MRVYLTHTFERSVKKFHRNQINFLEKAIEEIRVDPTIGELKIGNLAGIRVYKFHILNQLTLLAYTYDEKKKELVLLSLAPHENFYDNLKKQIDN